MRAAAIGTTNQLLSEEPTKFDFDTYNGKPPALKQLVGRMLHFRRLEQDERRSLGVIADAKGNGHIQLYRSESNGNDTDPKSYRSSITYTGKLKKLAPAGHLPALTDTGQRVYDEVGDQLVAVAKSESAAASSNAYDLTWQGLRMGKDGAKSIIGSHVDQSKEDVDSEGRAKVRTARAVFHNGGDFHLLIIMKAVWCVEVVDEDGTTKLAERTRTITSCEIKVPSPGVYVLSHRLAGGSGWERWRSTVRCGRSCCTTAPDPSMPRTPSIDQS